MYTAQYACHSKQPVLQPEKKHLHYKLLLVTYTCDFAAATIRFQNITLTTEAHKWALSVVTVVWTEVWTVHTLIHIHTHQTVIYRLVPNPAPTALQEENKISERKHNTVNNKRPNTNVREAGSWYWCTTILKLNTMQFEDSATNWSALIKCF